MSRRGGGPRRAWPSGSRPLRCGGPSRGRPRASCSRPPDATGGERRGGFTLRRCTVTPCCFTSGVDLDVLTEAIDVLSGSDPSVHADAESIETLQRQLARLESFVTNATAAFDAAGNWVPDGARNASGWLVARCRLPKARARAMVRRGRSLRDLPECTRAWADGDITAAQVDVIADLRSDPNTDALARDEEVLVGQASTLRYQLF